MAPVRHNHNWSDSDEEERPSGVETNVLLGIPDGKIETETDLIDAAVSRIGGLPALLPTKEPAFTSCACKSCFQPMELLVQLWCPFENSPMDRALYVWGCARSGCQGKASSVRAWRGLRYNETYAAKLKQKENKRLELQRQQAEKDQQATLVSQPSAQYNPFIMAEHLGGNVQNLFGFGAHPLDMSILSKVPTGTPSCDPKKAREIYDNNNDDFDENDESESDVESSELSLITALTSTTISESVWKCAPSYPPLYLSTITEYLPPRAVPKLPDGLDVGDLQDDEKKEKDITWAKEKYEDSLVVDQVFEKFSQRVAIEGKQCIRYELGGTPLPFASDEVSDLLWPKPASDTPPTTKPDFKVIWPSWRAYDATKVPRCPSCNASRVFECQLMPNLINVLRPTWEGEAGGRVEKMTDEERRKQIEMSLKKSVINKDEKRGMEWGTCLIFSCERDCLDDGKEYAWREEVVYIQWDV